MKVKKRFTISNIFVLILIIVIFILGLIFFLSAVTKTSQESTFTKPQSTPEINPYTGKRVVDKYPNENILWYHVNLRTDVLSGGLNRNPPLLQPDILPELFDLPMVRESHGGAIDVIEKIVYDTKGGYPYQGGIKDGASYRQYNSDFFVRIKGFSLDLTKTYQNKYAKATLSYVDPQIIPYLENKDYCKQDSDCMTRDSFCGYGSFNTYEAYADIYGCESPAYDLETVNAQGQPIFYDGEHYDQSMKCYIKASYSGSSCVKNQCKGTGRTLSCVNR